MSTPDAGREVGEVVAAIRPEAVSRAIGEWATPEFLRFMQTVYWRRLVALVADTAIAAAADDGLRTAVTLIVERIEVSYRTPWLEAGLTKRVVAHELRAALTAADQPTEPT